MSFEEILTRFWDDLIARPSGPLALRFLLQPVIASLFAIRDGIKDARAGRSPYFLLVMTESDGRRERLAEGLRATGKVIAIAVILDTIYQIVELRSFYPVEAIVVAITLAFAPYMLVRGLANRIARPWVTKPPAL